MRAWIDGPDGTARVPKSATKKRYDKWPECYVGGADSLNRGLAAMQTRIHFSAVFSLIEVSQAQLVKSTLHDQNIPKERNGVVYHTGAGVLWNGLTQYKDHSPFTDKLRSALAHCDCSSMFDVLAPASIGPSPPAFTISISFSSAA